MTGVLLCSKTAMPGSYRARIHVYLCQCATVLEDRYVRVLLSRNTAIPGPTVIEDRYPGVCSTVQVNCYDTVLLYKS
jgi:hypothetical protein